MSRAAHSRWPEQITEPKVIVAEGADARFFCIHAIAAYGLANIEVINFGGIAELTPGLKTLQSITGFGQVQSLGVIRDAEHDFGKALESVRTSMQRSGLPLPDSDVEAASGRPRTSVFVFPGLVNEDLQPASGTLEDLCLATIDDAPTMACVNAFIECAERAGCDVRHPHKARVHAYLAAHDKFVGMKLGEAARAGAWSWEHPALKRFRQFLRAL